MALARPLLAFAAFALSAGVAHAQFESVDAKTKATCRAAERFEPPAADRRAPGPSTALKGCDSEALYYGEGRRPDYVAARLCAYRDTDAKGSDRTDSPFSGEAILMQIYANGLGVPKNLDVALQFACLVDGAPAEIEGRVSHLQALKAKPDGKPFDYCDDITSGLAGGFCEGREAERAKGARSARLAALGDQVAPAARPLYATLRKASDTFIAAHGDGEVDMSGTARAQLEIAEEEASRDRFVTHLQLLLAGRWPLATAAQAASDDAALNSAYAKALAYLPSKDNLTTVKAPDVKTAQRAWVAYRDAFVRFARAAAPQVSAESIVAVLTKERTGQLGELG